MYTKRDIVYAEAGKMLQGEGVLAYQAAGKAGDYTEVECPVEDLRVRGQIATWGGGRCALLITERTYEAIKTRLVKMRYSNDDQIAVMLNGDEEEMRRMQAWREWAGDVAKAICRRLGKPY